MSIIKTGNKVHDDALLVAEQVRQAAVEVAGVTEAAVKTAHVAYFRSCIASAKTNGLMYGQFSLALREMIGQDT
jgi:hypothetical protein